MLLIFTILIVHVLPDLVKKKMSTYVSHVAPACSAGAWHTIYACMHIYVQSADQSKKHTPRYPTDLL